MPVGSLRQRFAKLLVQPSKGRMKKVSCWGVPTVSSFLEEVELEFWLLLCSETRISLFHSCPSDDSEGDRIC